MPHACRQENIIACTDDTNRKEEMRYANRKCLGERIIALKKERERVNSKHLLPGKRGYFL